MKNENWIKVTEKIKENIDNDDYNMYISPVELISFTQEELILGVNSTFMRDRIIEKFEKKIKKNIKNIFNIDVSVTYKTFENKQQEISFDQKESAKTKQKSNRKKYLDDKFIFTRFVPGPSNELAYAAAKRISVDPGNQYNPFFYYGNTGLGKTHLLQAIGHAVLDKNEDMVVIYVTSEKFLDEYVSAIQRGKVDVFRKKYRKVDVLLIDDVHFYEGKPQVQEELFNTFNLLFQSNKQMVFTSDRSIKELKGIEQRLITRFSQGIVADIRPPSFEERKAILNQKIKFSGVKIKEEVITFLADKITSNVRSLEGAVNKIKILQEIRNRKLEIEDVKDELEDIFDVVRKAIPPAEIINQTAMYYELSSKDVKGKKRTKDIAKPRMMAMYLMGKLTDLSYVQIGLEFGGRNHSTVSHACKTIEKEIKDNISTRNDFDQLYNRLIK